MEPCENAIKIEHDDPKMIQKFVKSFNENKVCETFVPEPDYSNEGAWYEWRYQNWGIKCDFGREDNDVIDVDSESTEVTVWFDTPDVPPIELYEYLTEELGFRIHAEFYQLSDYFYGMFETKDKQITVDMDYESLDMVLKSLENLKHHLPLCYVDLKEYLKEQLEDE